MLSTQTKPNGALLQAILDDDCPTVNELLAADSTLVSQLVSEARFYDSKIFHWLYVGDTPLHLAAAGYRVEIARLLLAAGADPNAATNHRHSSPLHYAADGYIIGPAWDPERQVTTIECLLAAGAYVNAIDSAGATDRAGGCPRNVARCPLSIRQPGAIELLRRHR